MPKSSGGGTVRAGVMATLRAYLARYPKVNADSLIRASGIDPRTLDDPDAVLDVAVWVDFAERAAAATKNPLFAIEYALQMRWHDLGVFGYVMVNSPTVVAALENISRYISVQSTHARLELERTARRATLAYTILDRRITEAGQNTEGTFALVTRLVRDATANPAWGPVEVRFRHDGPDDTRKHERFFAAPVRFGQRANMMVVDGGDLAKRSVIADANLLPILLRHAEDCVARMPKAGELASEVRAAVIAAISAGEPAIEDVAARLGTSPRSLQRRLRDDDLSFKSVVEETRLSLAQGYLADPALSLTETAFLLGYSDLSAFSRAFRRWTGTTAQEFRRRATP
ncbi:MAG: AraC family transcriptional regulator [Kofleriaceae bacterium]